MREIREQDWVVKEIVPYTKTGGIAYVDFTKNKRKMRKLDLDLEYNNFDNFFGKANYPKDPALCEETYERLKKKIRFRRGAGFDPVLHKSEWIKKCQLKETFNPKDIIKMGSNPNRSKRCEEQASKMNLSDQGRLDYINICLKRKMIKSRGRDEYIRPRTDLRKPLWKKPKVDERDWIKPSDNITKGDEQLIQSQIDPQLPTDKPTPPNRKSIGRYKTLLAGGLIILGIIVLPKMIKR